MNRLYVLFDAECGLCVRCRNWLMKQPAYVQVVFIPFQSDQACRQFPGIEAFDPAEQLLVVSNEGNVYRGASAWIMCLWALRKYREHAQRLSHPVLLPLAQKVCDLLSRNRSLLSDALFRRDPPSTAHLLQAHYPLRQSTFSNGACGL